MRMPDCKECAELKTFNDAEDIDEFRHIAIKWIKHFDSKPSLMNLGSCRTLMDLFDFDEKDIK